jgi:hypothetical protein
LLRLWLGGLLLLLLLLLPLPLMHVELGGWWLLLQLMHAKLWRSWLLQVHLRVDRKLLLNHALGWIRVPTLLRSRNLQPSDLSS